MTHISTLPIFPTRRISPSSSHRIRPRCSFRSRNQLPRSHLILTHCRALLSLSTSLGPTAALVLLRLSSRYPVKSRWQPTCSSTSSTSSTFLARPRWHQRPPAITVHVRYLCIYRTKFRYGAPCSYVYNVSCYPSPIRSASNHQHPPTCNSISVSNAAHAVIIPSILHTTPLCQNCIRSTHAYPTVTAATSPLSYSPSLNPKQCPYLVLSHYNPPPQNLVRVVMVLASSSG